MSERGDAPPRPPEGVVSWNVGTGCNYRCTYCTQRDKADRGRWAEDVEGFLGAFARLEGPWEVKLSGGEPFRHPRFLDLVAGLARLGLRISVVTNFSATDSLLAAFVEAAAGRVGTFSASLHLEYVDEPRRFAARARWLERELRGRAAPSLTPSVNVTLVATRSALARLEDLEAAFAAEGLELKLQPERQGGEPISYEVEELAALAARGGQERLGAVTHGFFGRSCWAGARSFILDHRGEVYRCYPARRAVLGRRQVAASRIGDPARERTLGRLGSLLDPGFRLPSGPAPCLHRSCYCSVPVARGMVHPRLAGELA